ncbi:hypothetical protein Q4S45_21430 [Massilia sp. R2A-15]|uniref:hypothetical protein n=1 Tax=Massilia sp. R2A-15 TaxID=3064278 RepID=UPI0027362E35|nr:hypothetical protein [Massilia sp. R2A-15]WLI89226.1 hypothetical protein Q4S45_21430 [Massilia sp. R2A-15]
MEKFMSYDCLALNAKYSGDEDWEVTRERVEAWADLKLGPIIHEESFHLIRAVAAKLAPCSNGNWHGGYDNSAERLCLGIARMIGEHFAQMDDSIPEFASMLVNVMEAMEAAMSLGRRHHAGQSVAQ